jgi:hypothetical protein
MTVIISKVDIADNSITYLREICQGASYDPPIRPPNALSTHRRR